MTITAGRKLRVALLLGLLPGIVGVGLSRWAPAQFLERSGLDFLFQLRGPLPQPPGVCVVALDDESYDALGVDPSRAWPRILHAELIRTLQREGARSVSFDVLFDTEGADPAQDEELEAALREAGNVVLGATVERVEDPDFVKAHRIDPLERFAAAAAAVGQVPLPLDRDGVIRNTWLMQEDRPGLALAGYEIATRDRSERKSGNRFIDFYGPPRTVKTVSFYQALDPGKHLAPRFFKDKLVFVGLSLPAGSGHSEKDAFPTPYRAQGGDSTFGVEIHATIAANLLEGRRVRTLPPGLEIALLMLLPFLAVLVFLRLGPVVGAVLLAGLMTVPWGMGALAFSKWDLWLPVILPSFIQLPVAYLSCLLWYYLTTVRERERIRRAFSFYLSPAMIGRIAADPGSLNLGGEEIVGTALMTDLQGFTTFAETLAPAETVALLNAYFSDVTQHIFDTNGTLIKFIGDAVFAIWGAPLHQDDHATRACTAALELMRGQAKAATSGPRLVTRIGVHTGPMVVGNLGSSQRFDYTAIGDAVNLASRLEGLNKLIGTRAIVSELTLAQTGNRFITRPLGRVRVVGRNEPVAIHELAGDSGGASTLPEAVIAQFAEALRLFAAREFQAAAAAFRAVQASRGGDDGPSAYYLRLAERFATDPPPDDWDGVVVFESK